MQKGQSDPALFASSAAAASSRHFKRSQSEQVTIPLAVQQTAGLHPLAGARIRIDSRDTWQLESLRAQWACGRSFQGRWCGRLIFADQGFARPIQCPCFTRTLRQTSNHSHQREIGRSQVAFLHDLDVRQFFLVQFEFRRAGRKRILLE
jgi:hypothetical protein